MKIYYSLIALFILCLATGCLSGKKTTVDNSSGEESATTHCKAFTLNPESYRMEADDPYQLKNARIEDDCLILDITYSGGCGRVNFDMVGHETQTKAPPPIYLLRIALADRDNCRSNVDTTLYFSLDAIEKRDKEQQVMIRLKNWEKNLFY